MTDDIYSALRNYLDRLAAAEYAAFKARKASKRKGARYWFVARPDGRLL